MSVEQLLGLFPEEGNRERITEAVSEAKQADRYGAGRFDLRPENKASNPRLAGINYITIDLLDERVTGFHVEYGGTAWENVDQFVAKLSEGLGLPRSSWEPGDGISQLNCDGFRVHAFASRGTTQSVVMVRDTSAPQVIEDRRAAAKEKVRQAFKP